MYGSIGCDLSGLWIKSVYLNWGSMPIRCFCSAHAKPSPDNIWAFLLFFWRAPSGAALFFISFFLQAASPAPGIAPWSQSSCPCKKQTLVGARRPAGGAAVSARLRRAETKTQAANAAWVKEGLCPSAAPPPKGWQGQIKVSLDNPGHMAAIPPPLVPIQCHWLLPGIG